MREGSNHRNFNEILEFLLFLSICHETIAEKNAGGDGDITYNACSPDDLCLVEFAKKQGYAFLGIDGHRVATVSVTHKERSSSSEKRIVRYKILNVMPFSSARKRMSIVCRRLHDNNELGEIVCLTKGADSTLIPRLASNQDL